ncbi:sana protein [Yersinia pseudotuberculosis]|nr:sana protein [Yersinia pseudotuberculosis]
MWKRLIISLIIIIGLLMVTAIALDQLENCAFYLR